MIGMEELYAELLLWLHGFTDGEAYNKLLDEKFLAEDSADILLDLETCSSDRLAALHLFNAYWLKQPFDVDLFERMLLAALRRVYRGKQTLDMTELSRRCYRLWNELPQICAQKEPLFTFCYIDDVLDEREQRVLLEKVLAFYENDDGA